MASEPPQPPLQIASRVVANFALWLFGNVLLVECTPASKIVWSFLNRSNLGPAAHPPK